MTNSTNCLPPDTGDGPDPTPTPTIPVAGTAMTTPPTRRRQVPAASRIRASARADRAPVGAGEPYKTKLFTVRGVGDGHAGRRSRARTTTGRRTGGRSRAPAPASISSRPCVPRHRTRSLAAAAAVGCYCGPPTCVGPSARDAKPTWWCSSSTPRDPWRPASGCIRSRRPSCRCCSTRTGDATGSAWSPSGTVRPRSPFPQPVRLTLRPRRLDDLPAGGRTPLAEGLMKAAELVRRERLRDPSRRPLLVDRHRRSRDGRT